jgi:branched-subunit amino acid ABC-type transport system permease component
MRILIWGASIWLQVTVAVLVGLLTISTWYFTHSYPKTAVANLSESLRLEILFNTSELLDEIFSMNTYGVTALANLMEKDFLGVDFSLESFMKVSSLLFMCLCSFLFMMLLYFQDFEWGREARNTAVNSSMGMCIFSVF